MAVRSLLVFAALVLVAGACSSDSATTTAGAETTTPAPPITEPTTSEPTTSEPTTVETTSSETTEPAAPVPAPVAAASEPPASFSEIETGYERGLDEIATAGRQTVDQFLADEFEAIWARLDAAAAGQLSVDDLRAGKEQVTAQAPLSDRVADRAIQMSPSLRLYRADLEWGEEIMSVTVSFNEAGEIAGLIITPQLPLPTDPAAGYQSEASFRLPFDGLWFVFWGGDVELKNHHVVAQDQRHALDLVVWKEGGTHRGDGTANEDYWAYGQEVISPAAGTVVSVVDGLADNAPQVESDPANPAGNHVVIEVAEGEYLLLAHMQAGSLAVLEGDAVTQGQLVGLVGNSGNTSEPHIHVHLQDQPTFGSGATGLPLEFSSFLANGQLVERAGLTADQFVANS